MDRNDFLNRLKVLHSIDKDELIAAGLGHMSDDRFWVAFRQKPAAWMLNTEDHNAAAVWALVEERCGPEADSHPLDGKLEPDSRFVREDAIQVSQAISLKRIADLLDTNLGDDARNAWGETPMEAIGGGIARALRP